MAAEVTFQGVATATKSACCLILPDEIAASVQAIRKLHDPAFVRWPAHTNLMFPFVTDAEFGKIAPVLERAFSECKPFEVRALG